MSISNIDKIRKEVERQMTELIQEREKGFSSDIDDACILELQNVLTFIDSLKEEPVSNELNSFAEEYSFNIPSDIYNLLPKEKQASWIIEIENAIKAGAKWQKKQLMKDTISAELYSDGMFTPLIGVKDKEKLKGIKFGDKVKLIIIKDK